MLTFIIHYMNGTGNQTYVISANSKQNFENQLNNFLKLNNLNREQITIECVSSIL